MPEGTSPLILFTLNLFGYRIAKTLDLMKYLPSPLILVRKMDLMMDIVRYASLKLSQTSKIDAACCSNTSLPTQTHNAVPNPLAVLYMYSIRDT